MTTERINLAFAMACPTVFGVRLFGSVYLRSTNEDVDVTTDLNAMREAEKILTEDQQKEYARQLHFGGGHYLLRDFEALHATAMQRAGAFLRTLNLWEDET